MLTKLDPGNEVSFASPYLFNFAGRQDLSVSTSRRIARSRFAPTDGGLPGNGDSGAMQSWLLWNMIGLYPLTGQTTFLIHSPWFEHLSIDLGGKKKLIVNSTSGDQDSRIYVQTLRVNAQDWKENFLDWNDVFAEGGTMEFQLGSTPNNNWFSGKEAKRASSQGRTKRDLLPMVGRGFLGFSSLLILLMIPFFLVTVLHCGGNRIEAREP
jgi:putative alpha-1,2-mannosidase